MNSSTRLFAVVPFLLCSSVVLLCQELNSNFARDPGQAVDKQYTDKIHEYTTDPSFTSPLVDYLPASKVPNGKISVRSIPIGPSCPNAPGSTENGISKSSSLQVSRKSSP
jgi:hypothetical protein